MYCYDVCQLTAWKWSSCIGLHVIIYCAQSVFVVHQLNLSYLCRLWTSLDCSWVIDLRSQEFSRTCRMGTLCLCIVTMFLSAYTSCIGLHVIIYCAQSVFVVHQLKGTAVCYERVWIVPELLICDRCELTQKILTSGSSHGCSLKEFSRTCRMGTLCQNLGHHFNFSIAIFSMTDISFWKNLFWSYSSHCEEYVCKNNFFKRGIYHWENSN